MKTNIWSTRRFFRKEWIIFAPPSTRIERNPSFPNTDKRFGKSTWYEGSLCRIQTKAPFDRYNPILLGEEHEVVAIIVVSADRPFRILEFKGVLSRLSTMILYGLFPLTNRTSSRGLSRMMVSAPTNTASWKLRNRWAKRREAGPLIHLESPVVVAIFPSKVWANFAVTKESRVLRYFIRANFCRDLPKFPISWSVRRGIFPILVLTIVLFILKRVNLLWRIVKTFCFPTGRFPVPLMPYKIHKTGTCYISDDENGTEMSFYCFGCVGRSSVERENLKIL